VFASRQHQLKDEALKRLEREWSSVELLIVDEVSFIGRAFFAKMHVRMQQGWALEHAGTRAGRLSSAGADTTIVAGLHVCRVRGSYVSQSVIARTDRIWRTRYSVQREHGRKEKEDDGS